MKKFIFIMLVLTLSMTSAMAQSPGAAKLHYDSGKLGKAKEAIDKALENEKHAQKWKTWYYKGLIYGRIAEVAGDPNVGKIQLAELYGKVSNDIARTASEAYSKALSLAEKDKDKATIKTDLSGLGRQAFNFGVYRYQEEDIEGAYQNFVLSSSLNPDYIFGITYAAGMAYELEKMEEYEKLLKKIVDMPKSKFDTFNKTLPEGSKGEDKSRFWINYVAIKYQKALGEEDETKQKALYKEAYEINNKGLAEFPNNEQLRKNKTTLASQIGNTQEAIKELEAIVASGKADANTYQSLGALYEESDADKAEKYFKKALDLDPDDVNSNSKLGVLYFNRAVNINQDINDNYDAYDEQGKADELKEKRKQIGENFKKAIPYFQKVTEILAPGTETSKGVGEERAKQFRIQTFYNMLRCYSILAEENESNTQYKQKKEEITKTLKALDPEFEE